MQIKGIYLIQNISNGKGYVGSSLNITSRWRNHKSNLTMNKHHNEYLQRSYNKYGKDSFSYIVLEIVEENSELTTRELFWIEKLGTLSPLGYNVCLPNKDHPSGIGEHSEVTKETLRKRRFANINGEFNEEKYNEWKQKLIDRKNRIITYKSNKSNVLVFDKITGELLHTFSTPKETSEKLQLSYKKIVAVLNEEITDYKTNKRIRSYKGLKFVYESNFKEGDEKISGYHIQKTSIKIYDENNNLVGEFFNARHASEFIGCSPSTISAAISKKNKLRNGYTVIKF